MEKTTDTLKISLQEAQYHTREHAAMPGWKVPLLSWSRTEKVKCTKLSYQMFKHWMDMISYFAQIITVSTINFNTVQVRLLIEGGYYLF